MLNILVLKFEICVSLVNMPGNKETWCLNETVEAAFTERQSRLKAYKVLMMRDNCKSHKRSAFREN